MIDPFSDSAADSFDVPFAVPMTHRLRLTRDCLGSEFSVLRDLFETTAGIARVQVWVDDGLIGQQPALVDNLCANFQAAVGIDLVGDVETLPGGEAVKNDPRYVDHVLSQINHQQLDRRSYILAIGGGALLDTVGYAAAVAHRGIRLIRLPTTTLAQADSGVGVKNAVNWFNKKNWKGTFSTPWAVVNDLALLKGLSDRDFRCGFSEAIKVALLKDLGLFNFLVQRASDIAARDMDAVAQAIRRSVLLHLQHITRGGDPFECQQERPLDFGHWSAHKLEAITNYQVRHGEAVAVGVAVDTAYSHLRMGLPLHVVEKTFSALLDLGLPLWHSGLDAATIFDGLEEFRQHLGGELTITLIQDIGQPVDVHQIDRGAMREAMNWVASYAVNLKS